MKLSKTFTSEKTGKKYAPFNGIESRLTVMCDYTLEGGVEDLTVWAEEQKFLRDEDVTTYSSVWPAVDITEVLNENGLLDGIIEGIDWSEVLYEAQGGRDEY